MLTILQEGVEAKEKLKGKKHQVFQLSFDSRKCYNEKMIEQKLDYNHHNPVSGKWNIANALNLVFIFPPHQRHSPRTLMFRRQDRSLSKYNKSLF